MKTLTKPEKSLLSSSLIYGYEADRESHWERDPPDAYVYLGEPPDDVTYTWVTYYYVCEPGGREGCEIGKPRSFTIGQPGYATPM